MGDLISRRTIINALESKKKGFEDCASSKEVKLNKEWNKAVDECISEIQMISAAYSVDKVVEEIKDDSYLEKDRQGKACFLNETEKVLEIVKRGGVNG